MSRYFSEYCQQLGIDEATFFSLGHHPCEAGTGFNMTAFALRITQYHNGVSKKHGMVAREMWRCLWPGLQVQDIPIDHITNGVHIPTWLNPRMDSLYSKYFSSVDPQWQTNRDNPEIWQMVDEIPDKALWEEHIWLKQKLLNRIREKKRIKWESQLNEPGNLVAEGLMLNPSVLTIGFARRFSTYKRADLIFHDKIRLRRILNNPWRPVQIIFAGKAHPADNEGKEILQRIYEFAQQPGFGGRIGFVEDYGEQMAQYLVHGVDVWMNNPIPPMEACGTSGMKASLNGVLNLSILDGWWIEGYNGNNGWAFEGEASPESRDASDAAAIYSLLENEVVPLYYSASLDGIPHGWVKKMKETIKSPQRSIFSPPYGQRVCHQILPLPACMCRKRVPGSIIILNVRENIRIPKPEAPTLVLSPYPVPGFGQSLHPEKPEFGAGQGGECLEHQGHPFIPVIIDDCRHLLDCRKL